MQKKLLIIGGEGNGGVVASCIEDMTHRYDVNEWHIAGFINDYTDSVLEYPVVGKTDDIARFVNEGFFFSFAVHPIEKGLVRDRLFKKMTIPERQLATIVHPSSFIAQTATISSGAFIMSGCYIGHHTSIGKSAFIKANCSVFHHSKVGDLAHIVNGSTIGSYTEVGRASDVCMASTVLTKVKIGDFSVLGAKSLATRDIADREVHVGTPAKYFRHVE
ncbi:PglD-related sugar-binding protein [Dethiosulfovibrio salsuginis]|uniref:Sugar O-acyltransferase, sialic acid O-acetyltransferase NeuD family n=1 Tax=Dethiosulfovibrio salsuginis TaxID=561720 RepID=A0A1X7LEW5_9BACT|nr:hypothetical protein [Dethiosulfovibrio salsuginis]SMG51802.1 sugar O-acyltransferase, sialic acid O-acetyltransferase NeuD family [Dethiosulfovibrio salsuginis]